MVFRPVLRPLLLHMGGRLVVLTEQLLAVELGLPGDELRHDFHRVQEHGG